MDERVEKAFGVANHMATLSNQRRIILEEFNQKTIYYTNGATFKITPELINFTKTVLDLGYTEDVAFLDSNFVLCRHEILHFSYKLTARYPISLR